LSVSRNRIARIFQIALERLGVGPDEVKFTATSIRSTSKVRARRESSAAYRISMSGTRG